jgi:phospholipid/cholesterol/gamma-HCH transport system permease protein
MSDPRARTDGAGGLRESIASLGDVLVRALTWTGGLGRLLGRAAQVGPFPPLGIYDISYQVVQHGMRSLPITTFLSLFVGMILAWQFGDALNDFGAKMALGYATSLALVRELVPTILAVTVGAKMAAGMTAELGSMKVTEQIDAIAALGADPVKKLVWPRVVAATIGLPLLVVWGNLVAMLGAMLIGQVVFDIPPDYFYESYVSELVLLDYAESLLKALVFGTIVGATGCFQGFNTKFGTEAVGIATTETIVATSILILIADFLLTVLLTPV